ncbi:MAG: dTDP-4-dehydrorhamnose reductase [Candidatus Atribacteria bacterium]
MIWLIGNKGMLGSDIERLLKEQGLVYWTSDKETDITNYQALEDFEEDKNIKWIINCAGYTKVDKAEEEIDKAFKINKEGAKNIALFLPKRQVKLIHISTDYIFDGKQKESFTYKEEDETNPINIYGKSKLAGEKEIERILDRYFIIRTAWLYGLKGNNFVYTMLRLFKERDMVKVVEDQWGSPTYTVDLAKAILKIIKDDSVGYGIYHFTNEGVASWYEFALTIYDKAKRLGLIEENKKVEIQPIKTEDYPTKALRPRYSVLSKEKIKKEFNLKIIDWDDALDDFLISLKKEREGLESRVEE